MNTRVITAHVPATLTEVDQLAGRLERSRGWIVKQEFDASVAKEEHRRQLTLDALADVDSGRVVDHSVVHAWAMGLESDSQLAEASLMRLQWTGKARSDLERLYEFLAPVTKPAAARAVRALVGAPALLLENPRIGERLDEFATREVRRLLVGNYEMRYEIQAEMIFILTLWHGRGVGEQGVPPQNPILADEVGVWETSLCV